MASLYADENVPLVLISELRRLGHDVLRVLGMMEGQTRG